MLFAFSPPCLYFSFVHCLSAVWLAPSFIRLYVRTLPKFQNLPKLKSTNKPLFIFILALTYPHFSFVISLSAVWLAPSFIRLYVRTLPKFQNLPKLKSTNNPLFIFILALTYPHFSFVISLSAVWLAPSFIRLYVRTLPKFQNLPKLKSTNNPLFIFILALTYPHFSFVISLSARAARTVICSSFVRHFFVLCSSFVRHLFVICSSFVRHLFVHCSFIVRLFFVFCSSHFLVTTLPLLGRGLGRGYFVRLFIICPCGSHRLLFVHCSSFL